LMDNADYVSMWQDLLSSAKTSDAPMEQHRSRPLRVPRHNLVADASWSGRNEPPSTSAALAADRADPTTTRSRKARRPSVSRRRGAGAP